MPEPYSLAVSQPVVSPALLPSIHHEREGANNAGHFLGLWFHQQIGYAMTPHIRGGDFVGIMPVSKFRYDAVYIISHGFFNGEEVLDLCRCQHIGNRIIHVYHDDPSFREGSKISIDQFNEIVRGLVVMRCIIDDRNALGL